MRYDKGLGRGSRDGERPADFPRKGFRRKKVILTPEEITLVSDDTQKTLFKARNGRPLYDSLRLAEAGAKIAKFTHLHPLGYLPAALMTLLVAHLVPLTPEEAKATIVNFVNKDLDIMMQIEGNKNMEDKAFLKKHTLKAIDLAKYATSDAEAIRQLGEGWTARRRGPSRSTAPSATSTVWRTPSSRRSTTTATATQRAPSPATSWAIARKLRFPT